LVFIQVLFALNTKNFDVKKQVLFGACGSHALWSGDVLGTSEMLSG